MSNLITYTKPVKIRKRSDGLYEFQYKLQGLIDVACTTFCKTVKEAIENAKINVKKYIDRRNEIFKLSETQEAIISGTRERKETFTGWQGIALNQKTGRWNVEIEVNGQVVEIGNYGAKFTAISAKKLANIKYGLPELNGKIEI